MLKLFTRAKTDPATELKAIHDGYELPTLPGIYLEALQQVRDEGSSAATLADLLSSDPGLTMRLLRTVNSAAFGVRSSIKSVHHAMSMLGPQPYRVDADISRQPLGAAVGSVRWFRT